MWPQLKYVNGYWDKEDYGGFFSCPQCGLSLTASQIVSEEEYTVRADLPGKTSAVWQSCSDEDGVSPVDVIFAL